MSPLRNEYDNNRNFELGCAKRLKVGDSDRTQPAFTSVFCSGC